MVNYHVSNRFNLNTHFVKNAGHRQCAFSVNDSLRNGNGEIMKQKGCSSVGRDSMHYSLTTHLLHLVNGNDFKSIFRERIQFEVMTDSHHVLIIYAIKSSSLVKYKVQFAYIHKLENISSWFEIIWKKRVETLGINFWHNDCMMPILEWNRK